jgi:hypothetical protein
MRARAGRETLLDEEVATNEGSDALKIVIYKESAYAGVLVHALYRTESELWACEQDAGIHIRPEQLGATIETLTRAREILRANGALGAGDSVER